MQGRTLWITTGDVDGPVEDGRIVKAARPLDDFCLRIDDGGEPVKTGTLLEIVETRPWGAAMAQEVPAHMELRQAADDVVAGGLSEWAS